MALGFFAANATAEARREGGDATAKLQMMLQQANAEKSQLAAENAKLKAERDDLKKSSEESQKQLASETEKLARASRDLSGAQTNRASLQQSFDTLKARFEKLVEQYKKTVEVLREIENERNSLQTMVRDYDVRVTQCEKNNETLYAKNLELIDLYEHKGFLAALKEHEPVTRIKQVEMENLMQDYRYQADEMRLKYPKDQASVARPAESQPAQTDGS
jgi:chromosome segregation ATPase